MAEHREPRDFPRAEIMKMADEAIKEARSRGVEAHVAFKFTCPHCGERCTFQEHDLLYEEGECFKCGKSEPVERAGFMMIYSTTGHDVEKVLDVISGLGKKQEGK